MVRGIYENLEGKQFGNFTVIKRANNHGHHTWWLCRCSCGEYKECPAAGLKCGQYNSCGCMKRLHHQKASIKHNMTKTRLYHIWCLMKQRCYNPKTINFKDYGGRGITVCDDWKNNFENFKDWALSNGYQDNLTIDRVDVFGNYSPNNCRWADNDIQQNNKRTSRFLTYKGEIHTISQWAKIKNIKICTIFARLRRNLSKEKILHQGRL